VNGPALASALTVIRLSLHVLAASVWVGGQIVMAGLVPTIRQLGTDAPRRAAHTFGKLSWPAYWVLVITGVWNYAAVHPAQASSTWQLVFGMKVLLVAIAGLGAYAHTKATKPATRGAFAGIGALASILAMILGVAIAG
jgi:putative copper export protein